jgi:hypothetical protein
MQEKNAETEQLSIKIASLSREHRLFHFEKHFFPLSFLSSIQSPYIKIFIAKY